MDDGGNKLSDKFQINVLINKQKLIKILEKETNSEMQSDGQIDNIYACEKICGQIRHFLEK